MHWRVKKGGSVSLEVKKGRRNIIIITTLANVSKTWTRNEVQQSHIQAVAMSSLRGACCVSSWDGESIESVYERFGVGMRAEGVAHGVLEWVKCGTLKWWFRHDEEE